MSATTTARNRPDHAQVERILTKDGVRLTLYEISRNTGVDVTFLSKIFGGTRRPSLKTAGKLAAYLNITIEELTAILKI